MRYLSVFSGVEAATLAWEPLGWEPVAFCEIDAFPSAVLAYRWPDVPNLGDITKVDWSPYHGAVDLVVGGSPCQSFSVAGNRTGLDGASGLMWEYVRCIREVMPRWLVWENVTGAMSSKEGEDFGCLLRALDEVGYGLAWRVLDAEFFGVPQRRERVFLVGYLGAPDPPAEVLFEPESLRWDFVSGREKRKALAGGAEGGARAAGFRWHQGSAAGSVGIETEQSPTLDATKPPAVMCMTGSQEHGMVSGDVCGTLTRRMHKDLPVVSVKIRSGKPKGGTKGALVTEDLSCTLGTANDQVMFIPPEYQVRKLTPRECERLQGMPDDHTKVPYRGKPAEECPDTPRYKAIGNSMAVPVMRWIGERIDHADID